VTGRVEPGGPYDSETGRIAALTRWAYEPDPQAATQPARDGFMARFERQVDPDNRLDPAEREVRAKRAMKAHMLGLARRSRVKRAEARLRSR
jgi:hypothetical protein